MKDKLVKKLNQRFAEKQNEYFKQPGTLGDGSGNLYPSGLSGHVYAVVAGNIETVRCTRVSPRLGRKVWIGYSPEEPSVYQVLSTLSDGSSTTVEGAGYAPAKRYEWLATGGGQDPLHVHLRAFSPLKIGMSSSGGMNVDLYRGFVYDGTDYIAINRQTFDLTSYIPATADKAAFVLFSIDDTGTVIKTDGADVDISTLAINDIPSVPDNTLFVCGAVRVYNGQTAVQEGRTNTDFVDLRFPGLGAVWGTITGDITNQADLASALAGVGSGANPFEVEGVLAVTADAAAAWLITGTMTISAWYIYCSNTGSGGGPTIIDIHKNGVTIWTNQANRPTLAYNDTNKWAISGLPDFTTFVEGDVLSVHIDQVATGAADLVVVPEITTTAAGLTVKDGSTTVPNVTEITGAGTAVITNGGTGKAIITVTPPVNDYILVEDQKSSGTNGGASVSGAWLTRDINTVVTDTGGHCSVASNQITLAAGTYTFNIRSPLHNSQSGQVKLYNVTDAADVKIGNNAYQNADITSVSVACGDFTIASPKVFEVRYRVSLSRASFGLGVATSWGTEIYTQAEFYKVA